MSHLVFYEKIFAQNWTFYETNETVDKKNGWSLSIFKVTSRERVKYFCVLRQHKVIEQQKITEICKPTDIKFNKSVEKDYTFLIKNIVPFNINI